MTISDQSKFARAPRASLRPVFHFLNFFLNVPPTSSGGTPEVPSRICGLRPEASVFAVRAGRASSAFPIGRAAPK